MIKDPAESVWRMISAVRFYSAAHERWSGKASLAVVRELEPWSESATRVYQRTV